MKLKISSDLSLPIEAVTQTFGILAIKGAGKSYTASVLAEEMLKNGQQVVILDITGAWYGLKSSADGKSDGFPIAIFGGDHADVPLEEGAGEIIATAIIEQGFSAIIDLSLFRKGQVIRFLWPFLEALYRLNRNPLHLFADEADAYVPQKPFGDQARTVGAMEDIVRRGRKKGIGCTLITQRPASINKDVLTQCEILIALRMTHPRDINAIKEWVEVNATLNQGRDMIAGLPSLPTGTAWVWSPSWLKVFQKVVIRMRTTFDSGATPKPGETFKNPKKSAFIDIQKLGKDIAETVERKKAEDPRELKKLVRDLQDRNTLLEGTINSAAGQLKEKPKEVHVLRGQQLVSIEKLYDKIHNQTSDFAAKMDQFWEKWILENAKIMAAIRSVKVPATSISSMEMVSQVHGKKFMEKIEHRNLRVQDVKHTYPGSLEIVPREKNVRVIEPRQSGDEKIGKCERKILTALAQYPNGRRKTQIALLAGYAHNGGSFNNALSKCRAMGWIMTSGDNSRITGEGVQVLGPYDPLPTGRELRSYWFNQLPKAERSIFEVLCNEHPQALTKEQIGTQAGYEPNGGSFNNALSKLRTLELIEGRGEMKASDDLF